MWPWSMLLILNRHLEVQRYRFMQSFIELSMVVHRLSCSQKKLAMMLKNNTVIISTKSNNILHQTRLQVQLSPSALSGNNDGQVVYTGVPLFTEQYNLVPAEGRWHSDAEKVTVGVWRRTGHVSQTQWAIHLWAQWPQKGRWGPRLCPSRGMAPLPLPSCTTMSLKKVHLFIFTISLSDFARFC